MTRDEPSASRRLYFSSDSYPELREIASRWERHRMWRRAFRSAFGDRRFWRFALVQLGLLALWLFAGFLVASWLVDGNWAYRTTLSMLVFAGALFGWGFFSLSWGGDLIRPHLRATSSTARAACPGCGHQMTGQLAAADGGGVVCCPECGASIPVAVFEPPYEIPPEFRASRR